MPLFTNNTNTNNDSKVDPKLVLTDEEARKRIEHIRMNKERRKQGLEYIQYEVEPPSTNKEEEQGGEQQPPKISNKSKTSSTSNPRGYAYFQSQMQDQLAYFQSERFSLIAQAARKEKHIIYKFDDNPEPPKLGEKKNTKASLQPIDVYYNEIPNNIHYELDFNRSQVQDLQYVKSLQSPTVDQDGHMSPAVLTRNDIDRTGISDKVFAKINEEINRMNRQISEKMALWYYGIPSDLIPKLETSSLANALEAGLYRELYGIVNTSKNSAVY